MTEEAAQYNPAQHVPSFEGTDWIREIQEERRRQYSKGFDALHDDRWHEGGTLADMAACYAAGQPIFIPNQTDDRRYPMVDLFPEQFEQWDQRDTDPRHIMLVKAAALILAELERYERTTPGRLANRILRFDIDPLELEITHNHLDLSITRLPEWVPLQNELGQLETVRVIDIRRNPEGRLEFQIGEQDASPRLNRDGLPVWVDRDGFAAAWPT